MSDQFDRASDLEALARDSAMAQQAKRAAQEQHLEPVGYCLNPRCCEDFPAGDRRLFCNHQCAAEHKRLVKP